MKPTRMVFEALVIKDNLKEIELRLGKNFGKAPEVISRSLNRAAAATKTQAVRTTSKRYYVRPSDIFTKIEVFKSSKTRLSARAVASDNKLPLERFKISPSKPKPKEHPVLKIGVKRDGGMKDFKGPFVIPNLKIYQRISKKRYRIKRIYGPAIPQLVASEKTRADIMIESEKTYKKRLEHEIKRVMEAGK
jgi:hypothetical protein